MRRLSLNRWEPAKRSGQNIPKNRCRTTIAERMVKTLTELPFIGDQVVCLSHDQAALDRAARRAGLPAAVSPHWLRHAHCSHALERGASPALVRDTAGHADLRVTSAYTHAQPADSSARFLVG